MSRPGQPASAGRVMGLAFFLIVAAISLGVLLGILWRKGGREDFDAPITTATSSSPGGADQKVLQPDAMSPRSPASPSAPRSRGSAVDDQTSGAGAADISAGTVQSGSSSGSTGAGDRSPLVFDCERAFRPYDSENDLRSRYGAENVQSDTVHLGEGQYWRGAILFPNDSLKRVAVAWRDTVARRGLFGVWIRGYQGERTQWQTATGITLGTDLRTLERLNGRPFSLLGFGWDAGGTVMSFEGGRVHDDPNAECRLRLRLSPPDNAPPSAVRLLEGDREFSSADRAMQLANPLVIEMFLQIIPRRE